MKKILLAVDAVRPDKHAFEFGCYLAKLTHSKLTGVFLEDRFEEDKHPENYESYFTDLRSEPLTAEFVTKKAVIETNISHFKKSCEAAGIEYRVHRDHGVPTKDLITESRFADMLVIDAETSFRNLLDNTPSPYLKKILHKAECAVIIAPETFEDINEILFCYENTAASAFAIREFTQLFPKYRNKKITVLHISDEGWEDTEKFKLKEWLGYHYTDIHFETMAGRADLSLFDVVAAKKNHFTVLGAYGRSPVSVFFRRSNADLLIRSTIQPIFIAHP